MADLVTYRKEFLQASEALDGLGGDAAGHESALTESHRGAAVCAPLSVEELVGWCQLTSGKAPAPPVSLGRLLEKLNPELPVARQRDDIVEKVCLLGDTLHAFLNIRPFGEHTGRIGRLLAAYLATCLRIPIVIFREREQEEIARGIEDRLAMRCYFAAKVREAILDLQGNLLLRQESYGSADRFGTVDGRSLLLEWNELLDARDRWARGVEN
jgi:hypothetical protein